MAEVTMSDLASPLYELPMTDEHLALIGRITVIWGQIDSQIDQLLMSLYLLNRNEFDKLFLNKMIGAKAQILQLSANRANGNVQIQKISAAATATANCLSRRNALVHGLWGWEWDKEENKWRSCAISVSRNKKFYLDELKKFYHDLIDASCKIDDAYQDRVWNQPPTTAINRRMYFSDVVPDSLPNHPPRVLR